MRRIKTIVLIFLIISLLVTTALYGHYTLSEQRRGGTSPVCHLSQQSRQFIVNEFGKCPNLPELIKAIEKYEIENFTYDASASTLFLQDFDFDSFLKTKRGVCWELAAFAKCVIHEISIFKEWDVANYILDVRINRQFSKTHSYNYVIEHGTIYAFDMTPAVTQGQLWLRTFRGNNLDDIYRYANKLNDGVYRVQ